MADQLTSNPLNRARERERGSIDKTCSPPEQVTGTRASVKPQVLFLKSTALNDDVGRNCSSPEQFYCKVWSQEMFRI
jgi:hypothetical protein